MAAAPPANIPYRGPILLYMQAANPVPVKPAPPASARPAAPAAGPAFTAHSQHYLNCGQPLLQRYCGHCRQKRDTHRRSLPHFLAGNLAHSLWHLSAASSLPCAT